MDHHYLNFWLWACLHDAEAYLAASAAFYSIARDLRGGGEAFDIRAFHERRIISQRQMDLAKYHFVNFPRQFVAQSQAVPKSVSEHQARMRPSPSTSSPRENYCAT
jgi:hypothetical protein